MSERAPRGRRVGFTLVELLVVIGIIALLVSILLPSLNKAREQSRSIKCLSNMRQISQALIIYSNENKGHFPAPGAGGFVDDWIYWEPARAAQRDSESRIAPYLGRPISDDVMRCPSDDPASHFSAYRYSYTVNWNICQYNERINHQKTITMAQIINSTNKIMVIDENSESIDDGCWAPQNYASDHQNVLSKRHDINAKDNKLDPEHGRGNVAFVDGHAEFFERRDAFLAKYYDPKVRAY